MNLKQKLIRNLVDEVYTLQEIETLTKIKTRTLRAHISESKLNATMVINSWRVAREDLIRYVNEVMK